MRRLRDDLATIEFFFAPFELITNDYRNQANQRKSAGVVHTLYCATDSDSSHSLCAFQLSTQALQSLQLCGATQAKAVISRALPLLVSESIFCRCDRSCRVPRLLPRISGLSCSQTPGGLDFWRFGGGGSAPVQPRGHAARADRR